MAKHACKKCHSEECECPEWIFTFADLVMLMMGFFVILWVLKPAPGKEGTNQEADTKWLETVAEIRGSFGWVPDDRSNDPVDKAEILRRLKQIQPHKGQGQGGETPERREGARGVDELVETIRKANQATEGGKLVFDAGDTKLKPSMLKKLDEIAAILKGHNNIVVVKGHTSLDDLPDSNDASAKMDLSVRRAQVVTDYLVAHGVSQHVVRVQGCSTFEPVVQGVYEPDAQGPNRRVEIEATATLAQDLRPAPPSTPPAEH